jgi:hypothetical protein
MSLHMTTVETARSRLHDSATEADLIAASDRFQREFLSAFPGVLHRELLRAGGRDDLGLIRRASPEAAGAVMGAATQSPACAACFGVMDMGDGDPSAGLAHYRSLAADHGP